MAPLEVMRFKRDGGPSGSLVLQAAGKGPTRRRIPRRPEASGSRSAEYREPMPLSTLTTRGNPILRVCLQREGGARGTVPRKAKRSERRIQVRVLARDRRGASKAHRATQVPQDGRRNRGNFHVRLRQEGTLSNGCGQGPRRHVHDQA